MRPPEPRDGAGRVPTWPTATTMTASPTIRPDGTPSRAAVRSWLDLLYSGAPGWVSAVTLPGGQSRFFTTEPEGLDRAVGYLARMATTTNVYTGCCTLIREPVSGRGGASEALAVPALWADLDVAGDGHAEVTGRLPLPDRDQALMIIAGLPAPTAVVDSGHGWQVWWLLDKPMLITDKLHGINNKGMEATDKDLVRRWGLTLAELGRRVGFHVDRVGDLARILRPPGTVNRKRKPVPVRLVECHPQRRYSPQELAGHCVDMPAPSPAPRAAQRPIRPRPARGESPAEAFGRLVSWEDILEPAGFTLMSEHGDAGYWRHPSATSPKGTPSATTDANGVPVLVVFSESAAAATQLPVGAGHRLTKFRVWSLLHYGGDEAAAARALRAMAKGAA